MTMTYQERMAKASAAYAAALGGEDYGNLMENRMVVEEMAFGGDTRAMIELAAIDALLTKAEAARDAIIFAH